MYEQDKFRCYDAEMLLLFSFSTVDNLRKSVKLRPYHNYIRYITVFSAAKNMLV